jgi:hypothetical protein
MFGEKDAVQKPAKPAALTQAPQLPDGAAQNRHEGIEMRKPPFPLLLCLGLAGCMVGPDYQHPTIETPAAYRYADKEAKNLSNTLWWEQFQDPVLNDLIRTALLENKDIKIAAARSRNSRGVTVRPAPCCFHKSGWAPRAAVPLAARQRAGAARSVGGSGVQQLPGDSQRELGTGYLGPFAPP